MIDLDNLTGRDIPGGCGYCNAVQRFSQEAKHVWSNTIVHDDNCPWYYGNRASRRRRP